MVMRALATAFVSLLIAVPVATAAPPWSSPQDLSLAHTFTSDPTVATSAGGTTLATWRWQDGIDNAAVTGFDGAARAPGASAFTQQRVISTAKPFAQNPSLLTAPVTYATSRAIVATVRAASTARSTVSAVFGSASGAFGTRRPLRTATGIRRASLAADAAGDAAIAWFEDRGVTTDRVYVSLRRRGGSFAAPLLIHRGRVRSVSVAVGPRGDVLVAWDARGTVAAALKAPGAGRFGAAQTIRSDDAYGARLQTALTANGRAVVAWSAQLRTEGGDAGDTFVQAAVRPAGAARFRDAQLLERTSQGFSMPVALAAGASNQLTLAWTGQVAGNGPRVRVASTGADGAFSASSDVSTADGVLGGLAVAGGQRLVTWVSGDSQAGTVLAAVAPERGGFGAPETVSDTSGAESPVAAYDGVGRRWTVVWSEGPVAPEPVSTIRRFVRSASRPATAVTLAPRPLPGKPAA